MKNYGGKLCPFIDIVKMLTSTNISFVIVPNKRSQWQSGQLQRDVIEDVESGSYLQNGFRNGFVDFSDKLFIESVDSVLCLFCQCVC